MPIDTKRLPVPEESFSPLTIQCQQPQTEPFVDKDGKRHDGRTKEQLRPIFLRCGVVSQARGSAYMEMNNTKIICAVYGPREVMRREEFSMKGQLNCAIKWATFSSQYRRGHQPDQEEKNLSVILEQALEPAVQLEKFPKARMDVFVTVIQDDGGCLAGAMTVASLALADAGIEMYDMVIGTTLRQNGSLCLLDPTSSEEYCAKVKNGDEATGSVTMGLMPSLNQVAALVQKGHTDPHVLIQALETCKATCQQLYPVVQQTLVQSVRERQKKQSHT